MCIYNVTEAYSLARGYPAFLAAELGCTNPSAEPTAASHAQHQDAKSCEGEEVPVVWQPHRLLLPLINMSSEPSFSRNAEISALASAHYFRLL